MEIIEAHVVHDIKNNCKLRICNTGEENAYNVNAQIIENDIDLLDNNLMPYEILAAKDHFDLEIITCFASPLKFRLLITWQDEEGKEFSKEQFCSLT